jgi:hypothetical protein
VPPCHFLFVSRLDGADMTASKSAAGSEKDVATERKKASGPCTTRNLPPPTLNDRAYHVPLGASGLSQHSRYRQDRQALIERRHQKGRGLGLTRPHKVRRGIETHGHIRSRLSSSSNSKLSFFCDPVRRRCWQSYRRPAGGKLSKFFGPGKRSPAPEKLPTMSRGRNKRGMSRKLVLDTCLALDYLT